MNGCVVERGDEGVLESVRAEVDVACASTWLARRRKQRLEDIIILVELTYLGDESLGERVKLLSADTGACLYKFK